MKITAVDYCRTKKTECDDKPFSATVGNQDYIFCCEKGFNKSLKDFAIANKKC